MDVLLTTKEAAAFLRVSVSTLHKMRAEGVIPYVQFKRRVLFRSSTLQAFVANIEVTNTVAI